MNIRLAIPADIQPIKDMLDELVEQQVDVCWDRTYPACMVAGDIAKAGCFVIEDDAHVIHGCFTLSNQHEGESALVWSKPSLDIAYLERLSVRFTSQSQGIGAMLLEHAKAWCNTNRKKGLRLFVLIDNIQAISLYERCGFRRVSGIFHQVIDETMCFDEYGYEWCPRETLL